LHQRHGHAVGRLPREEQEPDRGSDQGRAEGQSLPLRHAYPHRQGRDERGEQGLREATMNMQLSRRNLLKGSGALVVAFSLSGRVAEAQAPAQGSVFPPAKPLATTEVDAFLSIDTQGVVTVFSGKVDIGTGVSTALPQMVAEELDVDVAGIKFIQGDTWLTPDQGVSSGSLAIQNGGIQLRQAAAAARHALVEAAAAKLGVPKEELSVRNGVVSAKSGKSVSYGELIGG